jgi:hypothetical protein
MQPTALIAKKTPSPGYVERMRAWIGMGRCVDGRVQAHRIHGEQANHRVVDELQRLPGNCSFRVLGSPGDGPAWH